MGIHCPGCESANVQRRYWRHSYIVALLTSPCVVFGGLMVLIEWAEGAFANPHRMDPAAMFMLIQCLFGIAPPVILYALTMHLYQCGDCKLKFAVDE